MVQVFKRLIACIFIISVVGCSSIAGYEFEPNNVDEANKIISLSHDEIENDYWLASNPVINTSYDNAIYNYRAKLDNTKKLVFIQIYINFRNTDWYFINDAVTASEKLSLTKIDRQVMSSGAVHEDVAINITLDTLKKFTEQNVPIKLKGQRGDYVFVVNQNLSKAFLDNLVNLPNT